ncbi:MAG TPA: glycosyltransferase [Candidatus Dormibacteraeota bacterium]|nr:glycosyltransferase [Candidatus Dormibacteraeota bacterium]
MAIDRIKEGGTALKPLAIVSLHASPVAALGAGENGGMNVYVRAVCAELGRRGIPTEVFTRRSSPDGPDRVRLADRSWVTRLLVGPAEDIEKGRLFDLLPDFTEAILSEQQRRQTGYSLVHSHYWLSGWVAARLRDEWSLPWFHTFHTLARVKNERAAEGATTEPDHRIAVEQAIVRNCDQLIASSAQEADDLVRLYGASRTRLSVVAPGVDLQVFNERPTGALRKRLGLGDAKVVVFAGRLERLKGAETVIRAMAILAADPAQPEPPILLVIGDDSHNGASESATSGGERSRLEALAASLGIREQVRFMGSVDQPELAGYLSLAAVCVVPSYSESFGLVALEAAACGTPVVAARVGGLPTIVKDGLTGFTLTSHDPDQYAERIGRLLADDELRRCFSRRSRLVATQFTWKETVDRLVAEYAAPRLPELRPAIAG